MSNKRRKHINQGFTLVELIVVIVIILILAAVLVPTVLRYIGRAQKAACAENKHSIYVEMCSAYATGEYDSLEAAFNDIYGNSQNSKVCPNGGNYSFQASSSYEGTIICSIHNQENTGGSSGSGSGSQGGTYPGTTIQLSANNWPTDSDFEFSYSTVPVKAGGIFQYTDGHYYVITKDISLTKDQAASGPGGTVYGWFATQKLTGRIVSYENNSEQKSDLARGDLCVVNGDYYVYIDGGSWASGPLNNSRQWYKIP